MKNTFRGLLAILMFCSPMCFGQTYKVLYSFSGQSTGDGAIPIGSLVFDSSGNLYGTTKYGGTTGNGTVFELSPNSDGTWSETVLYEFCPSAGMCSDGKAPVAGLMLDAKGNLYGTTAGGGLPGCSDGLGGCGVIFELSPPSTRGMSWIETVLYMFCSDFVNNVCVDGSEPMSKLIADASGNFYGTTSTGGNSYNASSGGMVFELLPNGSGWSYSVLYAFCAHISGNECLDGANPEAGVTFDSLGNLYGTTKNGGAKFGAGTVYQLSPGSQGWAETVLTAFHAPLNQGGFPVSNVSLDSAGNLYGTTSLGGIGNVGSAFRLRAHGRSGAFIFDGVNGATPLSGVLPDSRTGAVYGTTSGGGQNSVGGNVFKIGSNGKQTVLYSFCQQTNCTDGASPQGNLFYRGGNLYGTASYGGANGWGVVYEITP